MRCDFCEHRCALAEGEQGRCGVRRRVGDAIVTTNYGEHVSLAVDPIEKKPLYHFLPGSTALSSALFGCNFRCEFCQNWSISQPAHRERRAARFIAPRELAAEMTSGGHPIVAFTYSEPTVWQDYMLDAAREVRAQGGRTAMVTNGFFTPEALERFVPWVDAFNIDLKGGDEFYRRVCGGRLEPVLRNIRTLAQASAPSRPVLEVTTMLLEEVHTVDEVLGLAHALDDAGVMVWHLSRFRPAYRMASHHETSPSFLDRIYLRVVDETSIPFVYAYGGADDRREKTHCRECGALCIDRHRFGRVRNLLEGGACPSCAAPVYGCFA